MDNRQSSQGDARRRRVQRLKKLIVLSALVWMIFPVVLSIVLFVRVGALKGQLAETQGYLLRMEEAAARQEQTAGENSRGRCGRTGQRRGGGGAGGGAQGVSDL